MQGTELWEALGESLGQMDELLIKCGRVELITWCCCILSAVLAVYFGMQILKQNAVVRNFRTVGTTVGTTTEKVVLKQAITSFSSVKPISNQLKPINSAKQGHLDTKGTLGYRDPEIDRILEEFRR